MAHYALIGADNVVKSVNVFSDEWDVDGEVAGIAAILDWINDPRLESPPFKMADGEMWLKCSFNTRAGAHRLGGKPFRKNFPGTGWIYRKDIDGFIPQQPFKSWTLNVDTGLYDPPVPKPNDGKVYIWSDDKQGWVTP